ncbi:MAG: hypothetical protein E2P06_01950 [Acidobacteria bacterium]|nr:MAG: hypothetical protein E2P06_01950 [Acidobacteriota bacterium]
MHTSRSGATARAVFGVTILLAAALAMPVWAQPPAPSRHELLRRARAEKAAALHAYEPGRLERWLSAVENEQTIENLFEVPSPSAGGYYLTLGNITTGAGLTVGTGYNVRSWWGDRMSLAVRAAGSLRRYWKAEVEASFPRLAGGRIFVIALARRQDFPRVDYFGPGPDSRLEDRTSYRYQDAAVSLAGGARPADWLSLGGGVAYVAPSLGQGQNGALPSIEQRFTEVQAPGLGNPSDYVRYQLFAQVGNLSPEGNPRSGGSYRVTYSFFDSRAEGYRFARWEVDLRQYVSFLRQRRVLAFRTLGSFSDPRGDGTVPFYLQPWLGGSHTLRGFRDYRLRDRHLILLQAEYRWEIFPLLETVLFYDTGKVAANRRELNFSDFDTDYGVGVRVGTDSGVLFRLDYAMGGRDGNQMVLSFSNVF